MKQILILFIFILSACSNPKNCEKYYNDYVDLRVESKDKDAIIAIGKAIDCNQKNEDYLFEKVTYLIELNKISEAKNDMIILQNINNSFKKEFPLYGLLELKTGNKNKGNKELSRVFDNLSKLEYNENNFNLFYYKLLLQVYIKGKKFTLKEIENQKLYNSSNEKATMQYLVNLINSEKDSLNVLCKAFKIKE